LQEKATDVAVVLVLLIISYSTKAAWSRERKKGLMECDMSFILFSTPPHPAKSFHNRDIFMELPIIFL